MGPKIVLNVVFIYQLNSTQEPTNINVYMKGEYIHTCIKDYAVFQIFMLTEQAGRYSVKIQILFWQ